MQTWTRKPSTVILLYHQEHIFMFGIQAQTTENQILPGNVAPHGVKSSSQNHINIYCELLCGLSGYDVTTMHTLKKSSL